MACSTCGKQPGSCGCGNTCNCGGNCGGNCGCGCHKDVKTQYIGELPIDNLESVADYFLAERDVEDPATGNIVRSFVRVPGGKLFPNANMDNIVAIETNNVAIEVPENQVRAVYIKNEGSANTMQYADEGHRATMLALGEMAGLMLVQNTGFVNIPHGHRYIVGVDYYAGENGEPVANLSHGTHLFTPISSTKLAVNIYYKD